MHQMVVALAGALAASFLIVAGAAGADQAPPLVDSVWLRAHACTEGVIVVDIRENPRAFARGHVPCAVHSPYGAAGWRAEIDEVPGMLPPVDDLAKLIGGLGISNDDHVVVVSHGGSALAMTSATRVYWTFKVAGHDAVSILDGGMAVWGQSPSNKTERGEAAARPATSFKVSPRPEILATAADIAAGGARLVDNRFSDYFMGINTSPVAAPGTLAGAANLPVTWLTAPDGRFHSPIALRRIAAAAGLAGDAPQVNFCNTGQMASLGWFVSHELLGNTNARVYDGSMAEWTKDQSRPVDRKVDVP